MSTQNAVDSLRGQRLLVTRAVHQSQAQQALIQALGGEAVCLPLIQIEPVSEADSVYADLKYCLLDLDLYQKVIFVSPNAARLGVELIEDFWPQLPLGIDWIGIGQQTVKQLEQLGIHAWSSDQGYDSEALLCSDRFQQVEGQRILILRGNGGRDLMRNTLTERGARVDYGTVYYRRLPSYSEQTLKQKLLDEPLSALLITSGESLLNLQTLITTHSADRYQPLLNTLLIVPSERIAVIARELGYRRVRVAQGPDDDSMVRATLPGNDLEQLA
jgi:uroporphyrinogen-III synthase